jgi:hypothetical protein
MKEWLDQKQYKKKQKIESPIVFQTIEDIFDLKVRMQEQTRRLLKISIWDQLSISPTRCGSDDFTTSSKTGACVLRYGLRCRRGNMKGIRPAQPITIDRFPASKRVNQNVSIFKPELSITM